MIQDSQVTPDELKNKLELLQKKLSEDIEKCSNKLDSRDARKHVRLLKRVVKTAKKINPDALEADIIALYNEFSNEQLIEIIVDQKAELKKIENDSLNNLLDGMNNNLQRHETLITNQGATIVRINATLENMQERLGKHETMLANINETSSSTAANVNLLVQASNYTIEKDRIKAEEKRKSYKEELKKPVFPAPFNPYKPATSFNQFPRTLKHDSK